MGCTRAGLVGLTLLLGCGSRSAPASSTAGPTRATRAPAALPALLETLALPVPPADVPDGDDDGDAAAPVDPGLATARALVATRIAPPPDAHPRVCDLVPLGDELFAGTAVEPIALDGARVEAFAPSSSTWRRAFDWDRDGEAGVTHEQGGQGFTRVRRIGGRLWVADADAPLFGGFGLAGGGLEGYLFVSDAHGRFAALGPGDAPPTGTTVVVEAFHVFDVVRYAGALVATGGTVAPARAAGTPAGTPFPGGLFVGEPDGEPDARQLRPRFFPGAGDPVGVVRTTYLYRFGGRLYVGLQNNEGRVRWDVAVLTGDPRDLATPAPVLARLTEGGGWRTLRWASVAGRLYWIAARRGDGGLWASDDGRRFRRLALPDGAGRPQDLTAVGATRFLLTTTGLYRAGAADRFVRIADAPPGDPFGAANAFCGAPLVAWRDALWAGSTRDGALYRFVVPSAP